MNRVIIHCDGLCEPNPGGVACYGWIARDEATGKTLKCQNARLNQTNTTNNLAEYFALENALAWVWSKAEHFAAHGRETVFCADSKLVVCQIKGEWNCSSETLWDVLRDCKVLIKCVEKAGVPVTLEWVPREQNAEADELSRRAYHEATGHEVPERPAWQKKEGNL